MSHPMEGHGKDRVVPREFVVYIREFHGQAWEANIKDDNHPIAGSSIDWVMHQVYKRCRRGTGPFTVEVKWVS